MLHYQNAISSMLALRPQKIRPATTRMLKCLKFDFPSKSSTLCILASVFSFQLPAVAHCESHDPDCILYNPLYTPFPSLFLCEAQSLPAAKIHKASGQKTLFGSALCCRMQARATPSATISLGQEFCIKMPLHPSKN